MKKIAILAAIAALTLSTGAQMASAQDKQLFNHASVGITAGLDGFGVEAALPASRLLQIRGGYSLAPIPINYNLNLTGVSSFVPINAKFLEGGLGKVMLDIFPVKESPFRITAGAYLGSGKLAALKLDVRDLVKPQDFGKDIGQNGVSASTDKDGFGYIDIDAAKLMPYLGLGFGRAVDLEARVSFLIEFGAAYTGGYDFCRADIRTR